MANVSLWRAIPLPPSTLPAASTRKRRRGWVIRLFKRGAFLGACLLLACNLAAPLHARSTAVSNSPESAPETVPPPFETTDIPANWLTQLEAAKLDPELVTSRLHQVEAQFEARIAGMSGDDRSRAEAALDQLRRRAASLLEIVRSPAAARSVTLPTQESYTLDEFLVLRARWRTSSALEESQDASLNQTTDLHSAQRLINDQAVAAYRKTEADSDERFIAGLNRLSAGIVLLTYGETRNRMEENLNGLRESLDELNTHLEHARQNLVMNPEFPDDFQDSVTDSELEQSVSALKLLQGQLVSALAESEGDGGFALLSIKMKLVRASARESLFRLRRARDTEKLHWHLLRAGHLEALADIEQATRDAEELDRSTRNLVEAWTAAGQATLVMPRPATNQGLDHVVFNEAQSAAREALVTVGHINEVLDDLGQLGMLLDDQLIDLGIGDTNAGLGRLTEAAKRGLDSVFGFRLFYVGDTAVTVGSVFKFLFIILIGFALSWLTRLVLHRIQIRNSRFTDSSSFYILGRILHYVIITIAVLLAFAVLGLDISNLALIAGALSVGIGFGLQSIVNNFLSGLILLTEGSLRVGDFVELDSGVTGVVKEIRTRFTRINTNDNLDVVVPNSELVSYRLTNWTLREPVVRLRIPFSVAYDSNKDQVVDAAMEAAEDVPYTLKGQKNRPPLVLLTGFGESGLDFELRVWVKHSGAQRPGLVKAAYRWALETRLKQHGITIPYPQRDLHIHKGWPLSESNDDQD
jgi:small-conductance mechanosensitive channel